MKNVKLLLVFFLLIFCQTIYAQLEVDRIKRVGVRYYHQKDIYDKHDLGLLLEKDSVAYEYYQRTVSIRKKAKITGITSLSLLGVGIGSIVIGNDSDRCAVFSRRTCLAYIVGPLAVFGSLLSGLASFSMYSDATIKRNRSVRIYNDNVALKRDFGQVPIRLDLKIDATNVGLVLNF